MHDEAAFLGTGWSFPPGFRRGGAEVALVAGVEDIHQSLHILLATRLGERVMQETFGAALDDVAFEEIDQSLLNTISTAITDAILYHEPRITLDDLDVSESAEQPGLLLIALTYTIPSTNSRFNMVYPFYVNEANTPL
ncbi:MAG: GPW/gp25 family protein [Oscillochloris sp.]|nr:GPW/gp25 family protein [Oscillochloris sp.]